MAKLQNDVFGVVYQDSFQRFRADFYLVGSKYIKDPHLQYHHANTPVQYHYEPTIIAFALCCTLHKSDNSKQQLTALTQAPLDRTQI